VRVSGVPAQLDGPLPAATREGTAIVRVAGRVVARVPLVTAGAVAAASLSQRASHFFSRPLTIALAVLLVACSLQLALMRRQAVRRRRRRQHPAKTEVA
jgi:D-alanyl-D-alanine carboxypeptidase (penicillin-binding protein 5/6)